ncbi:MAG: BrnT family toxin [Thermoanaerobaculia bacterium]
MILTAVLVTSSLDSDALRVGPKQGVENRRKHGIDFLDAVEALEDPGRLEEIDRRFDYGEERFRVLGRVSGRVLLVIATPRGEGTLRIISARRATRDEQERYFTPDPEAW